MDDDVSLKNIDEANSDIMTLKNEINRIADDGIAEINDILKKYDLKTFRKWSSDTLEAYRSALRHSADTIGEMNSKIKNINDGCVRIRKNLKDAGFNGSGGEF